MLIKLEVKFIDGKPVVFTPSGEQTTIEDAMRDFDVKDGECIPINITISDIEYDMEYEQKRAHKDLYLFKKTVKEKYPDGYFRTKEGQRVKIRGIKDSNNK